MKLYTTIGLRAGSPEATALSERLAAWHDAMVAHERQLRAGRAALGCHDDCPHEEARVLWPEAVATFAERADDLSFLKSRATSSADRGTTPRVEGGNHVQD
jgi:hypothetical protein